VRHWAYWLIDNSDRYEGTISRVGQSGDNFWGWNLKVAMRNICIIALLLLYVKLLFGNIPPCSISIPVTLWRLMTFLSTLILTVDL